ncbi:MAG: OmpH family outer membrane protein [Planctomycetota bacterium]|jgi:Skp family chaperone for outer membrane proteins
MRHLERVALWSALAGVAAFALLRGAERPAVAVPVPAPEDLGPADALILKGKDANLQLRNADGRLAFGDQPTSRAWSVGAVNSDKTMKLLLKSERFEDERKRLEEQAKGKDEEFRKRYSELEAKYKDLDPKSPDFEQGRAEVEGFFKEVEGWRKEIGEKLSKLQAEQIEKAYREMTAAVDVVAERGKVDLVLRFVPTAQAFESNTPADAMLAVQVRTFLHYPDAIDLTTELLKELSLKDE